MSHITTVKSLVTHVPRVAYSQNIAGVAVTMDLHKLHCVLVEHHDGSMGIVTEKDIVREVVARCRDPSEVRAWEIMKRPVISVEAHTSIPSAVEIMKHHRVRNLIVVENGVVLGVVKRSKILNSLDLQLETTEDWVVPNLPHSHQTT